MRTILRNINTRYESKQPKEPAHHISCIQIEIDPIRIVRDTSLATNFVAKNASRPELPLLLHCQHLGTGEWAELLALLFVTICP